MRNKIILAGVAALAFAGPALAQGKGNGGGPKSGGGGGPAKMERGGGGPKADRGGGGSRMERMGGGGPQMQRPTLSEMRDEPRGQRSQKAERGRGSDVRVVQRGIGRRSEETRELRGKSNGQREARQVRIADRDDTRMVRTDDRRDIRVARSDGRYFGNPAVLTSIQRTGLVDGCPPGLAAKNNGCLPPGQARKLVGAAVPAALGTALLPPIYRSWYPDNDDYYYRTEDGYVYRIDRDRNIVDAFFPLSSDYQGAYYVGAAYPQEYLGYYNVPVQYQPWYADSADSYYRYGDGAIYQVDPRGGVIESIVSLLAGDFALGQQLPAGYDVYNLPYAYRDRYVDSQDAWYRYNDGYIYQVDPTTRLVQAIVEKLV